MTKLRDRKMAELQLRTYSEHTIYSYIGAVERFARHFGKSPAELGADHVNQFLLFLENEKKVVWQEPAIIADGEKTPVRQTAGRL